MTNLIVQPDDIIRQKERNGAQTWWIAETLLLRAISGLSEGFLRTKCRYEYAKTVSTAKRQKDILPDTGKAWRYARMHGRFYYAYANIPDAAPTRYRSRLPQPETLAEQAAQTAKSGLLTDLETLVNDRLNTLERDYLHCYVGYRTDQMQRLARACAALELCIEMGRERGAFDGRGRQWFMDFGRVLDALNISYLPTHWRRLYDKVQEVMGEGKAIAEVIDLPRRNNQNAVKIGDQELESWVIQLRGMPQNFTNAWIIRKVRQMCELSDKTVPSESWLAQLLAQPHTKFLTSAGRYGARGRKGQVYRGYTPAANALFAGDAWQMDGTRVNFIPWKNADTGREEFLYIVVVRDVHSGAILGTHFSLTEDRWAYVSALRMAVNATGHLPYELILDRFPGHNTDEWRLIEQRMETVGVNVSYKFTAQSKAQLERWFETLQSVFFQESAYYYGEGIQSSRAAAHRSAEYIKAVRKTARTEGWNFDTAVLEATQCINRYNETTLDTYSRLHRTVKQSPLTLHNTSEKPHIKTLADYEACLLFGLTKRVSLRNGGLIRTEIRGVEHIYRVDDYDILSRRNQVLLAYDMENLNRVWLFEADGANELAPAYLGAVESLQRVQVFGPTADYKALGKDQGRRNKIETKRRNELETIAAAGSPVHILLNGMGSKAEAEAAETSLLSASMTCQLPEVLTLDEAEPETETSTTYVARFSRLDALSEL